MLTPAQISELPHEPGVYRMYDATGSILYIGKAKDLRKRVSSYFKAGLLGKTAALVAKIVSLDFISTDNEIEALILESNLVKRHKPQYNILLRDDKHFPYIKITTEEAFPRLEVVRRIEKDGGSYFGPYPSSKAMRRVIALINQHFLLRKRPTLLGPKPKKPCLNYQIGQCLAPCAHKIEQAAYKKIVDEVLQFLRGDFEALLDTLQKKMKDAAATFDFEMAARCRDQISAIEQVFRKQKIIDPKLKDRDVLVAVQEADMVEAVLVSIRRGGMQGQRHLSLTEQDFRMTAEAMEAFIKQHYGQESDCPPEILLSEPLDDQENLQIWLSRIAGRTVRLRVPERGPSRKLVLMGQKNARLALAARKNATGPRQALQQLQKALSLPHLPARIECIDNSNLQGNQPVASLVVCVDGMMERSEYRRYKIKTVVGADDFATMREVVGRRLDRLQADGQPFPDLLMVDGGKGQLGAALQAVAERNLQGQVRLAGIAKGRPAAMEIADRQDRIWLPDAETPAPLAADSSGMLMLQKIRDEAHRFAVAFHSSLRHKQGLSSSLDQIPGVGALRKRELLRAFKSLSAIRDATFEQLLKTKGVDRKTAQAIYKHFHGSFDSQA